MIHEYAPSALLTDFYELTMANGYHLHGMTEAVGYFDLFFRRVPDDGGFAIMAGLQQAIEYISSLRFAPDDIAYLRGKGGFTEDFLRYLEHFQFTCDVWAIPEGTVVFPREPLLIVRGPLLEAQLVETMLLVIINHQCLVATKANRIVRAAAGRTVYEFGSRRAHGYMAAMYGARAAYIGGCAGTACALAEPEFGIPAVGTMAHSWVQSFDSEKAAFTAFAQAYPDNCVLLVDTFNVLQSGVPNAIAVYHEVLKPMGKRLKAIRIDSGDITYLSKKCRALLDAAGLHDCKIMASNSLDEYIISGIQTEGACVDVYAVGERLITSRSEPVFGGIYKMVAIEKDGVVKPTIKRSENVSKITVPGFKKVYRLYAKDNGMAIGDVVTLYDEVIDESQPYVLFDPEHTWKHKTVTDYTAVPLLERIFDKGRLVYTSPDVTAIRDNAKRHIATLWDEVKRLTNPQEYYVDLSRPLWTLWQQLLNQ